MMQVRMLTVALLKVTALVSRSLTIGFGRLRHAADGRICRSPASAIRPIATRRMSSDSTSRTCYLTSPGRADLLLCWHTNFHPLYNLANDGSLTYLLRTPQLACWYPIFLPFHPISLSPISLSFQQSLNALIIGFYTCALLKVDWPVYQRLPAITLLEVK